MAKKNGPHKEELKKIPAKKFNDNAIAWGLGIFAFLLYAQTISYEFALDDIAVVKANKFVHDGFGGFGQILTTFYWAGFWQTNSGLFRPASLILFAIEWAFAPNKTNVFHFVNVALYATCAILLYKTLRELLKNYPVLIALGTTLLWIVLPVHTEVVANVKSADELLSLIFSLMMLRRLLRWYDDQKISSLLIAGGWLMLSLLSKEGAALFIPMALLALWMFRGMTNWKDYLKPVAVLGSVSVVWFAWHTWVIANAPTAMIKYDRGDNILTTAPDLLSRFATAMNMQGKYFQKLFLGFPLSYDYSWNENPIVGLGDALALLTILAFIGLIFLAVKYFRKYPVISFGIFFYFVTFALTSNIFVLIGATMADRFLFLPSVGACLAVVFFLMKQFREEQLKVLVSKTFFILLGISLIFSIRTFSRSQDWSSETTLFAADVDNAPGSGRVLQNYAITQMNAAFAIKDKTPERAQMLDVAYDYFVRAAKIDTSDFRSLLCLGQVEYNRGNYMQSAAWSKKYIDYFHARGYPPGDKSVYSNLGDAYVMYGRADSAILAFTDGLKADTMNDYVCTNLGAAYLANHDTLKAIKYFENSVNLNPKSDRAWDKLANVCGMHGDYDRSTEAFQQLIAMNPNDPNPYRMIMTNYLLKKTKEDTAKAQGYLVQYKSHGGK
ncbi:MAG TPA: glycosyltransferase family 39 protein [Bacteroidia bacterium]|nr:glycosyltransferase family 39 protein [Bacteroidia bacterium]